MRASLYAGNRLIGFAALAAFAAVLAVAAISESASGSDWLRFRGPNGSGISGDSQAAPVTWSPTQNIRWKVALPGPGSSCPIVVGERVLVTCWSGYGTSRDDTADQSALVRHLLCFDRRTGKQLWDATLAAHTPEDRYGGMFAEHGYASHTPVSDGKRVFVFFGKSGAAAFDLEGTKLWQTSVGVGSDPRGWGSASSPVLYKNLVIITASAENESLAALDQETGKVVWQKKAAGFGSTWGTPVLVKIDDQRTDLVLGVPYEIWGFDPDTGKFRWFAEAMSTDSYCSSVVADGQVVYGIEGRGGGSIAVRVGGSDDVTKSHVVWNGRDSNRIGTPIVYEGRIYFVGGRVANCIDASTGDRIYQERLTGATVNNAAGGVGQPGAPGGRPQVGPPGGPGRFGGRGGMGGQDYSSPVVADGKLYHIARGGDMYVVKLGPKFEQLAVNRVTADAEDFSSTPAVSEGELFIRSSKHLYCVGGK